MERDHRLADRVCRELMKCADGAVAFSLNASTRTASGPKLYQRKLNLLYNASALDSLDRDIETISALSAQSGRKRITVVFHGFDEEGNLTALVYRDCDNQTPLDICGIPDILAAEFESDDNDLIQALVQAVAEHLSLTVKEPA